MASKALIWHPAIALRPTDNLISSEMIRFKRFVPSYETESRENMAKIISHDYERIWKEERKQWANLCLPVTNKRTGPALLLRKVVNTNLRKKGKIPDKYRPKGGKIKFLSKSNEGGNETHAKPSEGIERSISCARMKLETGL